MTAALTLTENVGSLTAGYACAETHPVDDVGTHHICESPLVISGEVISIQYSQT